MAGVDEAQFEAVRDRELAEIERRRKLYLGNRAPVDVPGVSPSSSTMASPPRHDRAALRATPRPQAEQARARHAGRATDTSSPSGRADDVICLEDHEFFGAIGYYYADFRQLSDREVKDTVARFPAPATSQA